MIVKLAKVVGNVVSTIKHNTYEGLKLLIVRQVDQDGEIIGKQLIAVDNASAGEGDFVLLVDEGGAARMMVGSNVPVDAVIVGVLDSFNFLK